ncbi:MAG TPA: hypothetical protein DCS07_13995 [Bdellovibrionales bacterium]|nr:MAG: hypothetical protein A2Z97_03870 [Bdellovibrionales bacterium GWB1_52_6]OFZ04312.1 MAG: hypothetical protein A2X97_06605 [Bdellovibrionales bacterium GWA1_52_35]OFZ43707.1 MAG: hypothetical protein A2070_05380 [Bdellovibrionales bacterium GWC1_52_8]HAR43722.1 hypothetical protein [Bdellovibrionales bacterium]HCM40838.1 hypothetical protein [Bdellovibrionales bacterium]
MKTDVNAATILITTLGLAGIILFWAGCGSPDDVEGLTDVNGNAVFGSQCPYGSLSKPFASKLYLWDCPLGLDTVDLVQPLRPIVLQADCKKKIIVARTLDGALDTSWEVLPNGTFSFSIDGGYATLRNDGRGNANCSVPLTAELSGSLDCADRDKVKISVESVWWLDRLAPKPTANPSAIPSSAPTYLPTAVPTSVPTVVPTTRPTVVVPNPRPTRPIEMFLMAPSAGAPSGPKCGVPQSCYFFASTQLQQCE